jgi:dTMP kinase
MAVGGRFVTFEGADGAGKSTQMRRLAERLAANGFDVVVTHEPGGPANAESLRRVLLSGAVKGRGPLTEAMLFAAARAEHVGAVIAPALERGKGFLLCDRFTDSTRVYQGGAGVPAAVLDALDDFAAGPIRPHLTILLDVPAEIGRERVAPRDKGQGDRFESEPLAEHEKRREAFLALARAEPDRIAVVDAHAGEDFVAEEIARLVAQRFSVNLEIGRRG